MYECVECVNKQINKNRLVTHTQALQLMGKDVLTETSLKKICCIRILPADGHKLARHYLGKHVHTLIREKKKKMIEVKTYAKAYR